eukprot:756803-Rhodomonas_salina.1
MTGKRVGRVGEGRRGCEESDFGVGLDCGGRRGAHGADRGGGRGWSQSGLRQVSARLISDKFQPG